MIRKRSASSNFSAVVDWRSRVETSLPKFLLWVKSYQDGFGYFYRSYPCSESTSLKVYWEEFDESHIVCCPLDFTSLATPSVCDLSTQPKSYREETVSFRHGQTELTGVICLPGGAGPFPVVVYVAGSGPAGRDGYGILPPHWDEFARRGVASLAWDKPGVGESTGDWLQKRFVKVAK